MQYSVIIPCYNCESTLEKTVNSIQACGLADFEIILVDDGSPGGTPALCDRLAAEQKNVRCFHQPNGGVSSARNHGLTEAQGDYVWFFDSDDLVDPGSMDRAVQITEAHAPDMLIFGMSFDFYKDEKLYDRWNYSLEEEKKYLHSELDKVFEELFFKNAFSSSCNKLFSRKVLDSNQFFFNEKMHAMEDFQFVLRALSKCNTVYVYPKPIYRYLHFEDGEKESLDPSVERASHIDNIGDYMNYFEPYLLEHKELLVRLHYMLLRQKMRAQTIRQMRRTANQFRASRFNEKPYLVLCTSADLRLAKRLQKNQCLMIYARRKMGCLRNSVLRKLKANNQR